MKLLVGGGRLDAQGRRKRSRCRACQREVALGSRHKRPGGAWCSGVAEPNQELAVELARSVHVAVSDMLMRRDWNMILGVFGKLRLPTARRVT